MITMTRRAEDAVDAYVLTGLPQVNLLPPEIIARAALRGVQRGLGLVVLGAVVVVGLLAHQASSAVGSAQGSLAAATSEQAGLRAQTAQYADVTAAYARATAVQQLVVTAMGSEVRYSRFLNDLAVSLPPNVWLTNASWNQPNAASAVGSGTPSVAGSLGTVTFTGVAYSHDDVAVWLEALARQKGYASPYLQSSTAGLIGSRPTVTWTASVVLTSEALSGRFVTTGR